MLLVPVFSVPICRMHFMCSFVPILFAPASQRIQK